MSNEPYCWRATGGSIWRHKTSADDVPLYDQSAIDAAVAAERERCAKLCEGLREAAEHSGKGLKRAGAMSMATACARLIMA